LPRIAGVAAKALSHLFALGHVRFHLDLADLDKALEALERLERAAARHPSRPPCPEAP
jgi:hypothetical protein